MHTHDGQKMKISEVAAAAEDLDCWRGIILAIDPFYG